MTGTRVKICGIRTPEEALAAAEAGADFIGIVLAPSPRRVSPEPCLAILEAVWERRGREGPVEIPGPARGEVRGPGWYFAWQEALEDTLVRVRPLVVGVFADQPLAEVNEIADAARLDLVQLSGGEAEDAHVASCIRPVIRALHVDGATEPEGLWARAQDVRAALVLLDTADATRRGGTGTTFPWERAIPVAERLPVMLAGGLNAENVRGAIEAVRPWAVDVSSGVERGGRKDPEEVARFVAAAKGGAR